MGVVYAAYGSVSSTRVLSIIALLVFSPYVLFTMRIA